MSRFARIVEDPEYEEPVASDWAEVLDGFVTVAEKPHEEYSPFETVNSQGLTFGHFGCIIVFVSQLN